MALYEDETLVAYESWQTTHCHKDKIISTHRKEEWTELDKMIILPILTLASIAWGQQT